MYDDTLRTPDSEIDKLLRGLDDDQNPSYRVEARAKLQDWLSLPYGLTAPQRQRVNQALFNND